MSSKKSFTLPFNKASNHERLYTARKQNRYDFSKIRQWFASATKRVPYQDLKDIPLDEKVHNCGVQVDQLLPTTSYVVGIIFHSLL